MRILVGGAVADATRIEHDEIGAGAHRDDAPVLESEAPRRQRGHLVDRLGQAQHALLACVLAQNPRERAIAPGVRLAHRKLAVRRERRAVRADHDCWMSQRPAEIALIELEEDHVSFPALGDNQLDRSVERIHPAAGRDLGDALALGVRASAAGGHHHVLPPDAVEQALTGLRRLDVPADPGEVVGVGEALEHGIDSTLERPIR